MKEQPNLVDQVVFFNTSDGLWWRLGLVVEEKYQMTANGPGWTFKLDNNAWLRDLRDNPKFRAIHRNIANDDVVLDISL